MRWLIVVAVAACGSKPPPEHKPEVAARPPPPPARTPHTAPPDCSKPSRTCVWVAEAERVKPYDAYATTHYGDDGVHVLAALRTYPGFEVLIVEPGLVARVDEFVKFVTDHQLGHDDPWFARAEFSNSLGVHRVYRGMALEDDAYEKMKTEGILSGLARSGKPPPAPRNFASEVIRHVMGDTGDALISVSDDPAVSRCVAFQFGMRGGFRKPGAPPPPKKQVYVFELDVPVLDLLVIDATSPICGPEPTPASMNCITPSSDEQRRIGCRRLYQPSVESFVAHRIDPGEYKNVTVEAKSEDCKDVFANVMKESREKAQKLAGFCVKPPPSMRPPEPTDSVPVVQDATATTK